MTARRPWETLRVSSKSNPKSVASAMVTVCARDERVQLNAIGAGAVNQAVKAIAIARGYLAPDSKDLVTRIGFETVDVEGNERTAMRFRCEIEVLGG